jgi:GH25 family lysozyme M1 (1,4-beta-N-acetylmuramidase)
VTAGAVVLLALTVTPAMAGGEGYAGSSHQRSATGSRTATAQPPQPTDSLPGIDVSHFQHAIDWTQVAASGVRFAFVKASEGTGYVDPMYATNQAGAMAAGITVGAYHFARPDLHPSDPIPEADHFVDTAQFGPGNLLPVLDLERSGTLTPEQLTQWILGWLGEVTARTGVRPIVYTSPLGWTNRTDDTTAIADAGYTVLWIAHWNVPSPTLPANDWQGHGWAFWQYSDCGSVPGIQGCVDSDWFNGLALDPMTIPNPDQTPPVATITTPTGVVGPITASFDEVVQGVTPQSVALRVQDTQEDVPSARSCTGPKGHDADCATGKVVSVTLLPSDPLVPGQTYAAMVNPAGVAPAVTDPSGNVAAPTEQDFTAPSQVEQGSPAVQYGWRTVPNAGAYGGSFSVEHLAGATASYAFTGRQVTWFTVTGPVFGKAAVSIDGRAKGTFDDFAPTYAYKVGRTFRGLDAGAHTITITVLGQKGSTQATDTRVAIDAFTAGGKTVWTPTFAATWRKTRLAGASGGSVAVSDLAGASTTFTFHGTGVQWGDAHGPFKGRAEIYVDGALVRTVDDYAGSVSVSTRSITGLAEGVHTLRVVVLGEGRPAAKGTEIALDDFIVVP